MFVGPAVEVDSLAAWRAPLAAFLVQFLLCGYGQASGLVLISLHEDFGLEKAFLLPTAVVGFGLEMMLAPLIERFCAVFGARVSLLVSTAVAFVVMATMSWIPISGLAMLGVLGAGMGIARSFASFPTYNLATLAFRRHRGVAGSFMRNGVTIGAVFYPVLLVPLLDFYGSRITLLLLGAFFLNLIVATILLPTRIIDPDTGRLVTSPPKCTCSCKRNDAEDVEEGKSLQKSAKQTLRTRKPFLISYMTIAIVTMVCITQVCHIYPLFADENGHPRTIIALSISTRNGCDMLARALYGFINDRIKDKYRLVCLAFWLAFGSVGTLLMLTGAGSNLAMTVLFSVAMGLSNGIFTAGWMPLLVDFTGETLFPKVLAILMMILGALLVAGTFVVSEIVQLLDSHLLVSFAFASGILVSALGLVILALTFRCCRASPKTDETELTLFEK